MNEATTLEYLGYQGNPENNQAVFGFVARHLLRQQAKSSAAIAGREETLCVFRSPGGLMCAAGCLVPDADYDPQWEHDGEIGRPDPFGNYSRSSHYFLRRGFDLQLLSDLQWIHDVAEVNEWSAKLAGVASDWGLRPPVTAP